MTAHREDGVRKFCVSLFAVMMAAILHTPALADPHVRRALSLAINRQQLNETVFRGTGTVPNSVIQNFELDASDQEVPPFEFNLEKAKEELAKYPDIQVVTTLASNNDMQKSYENATALIKTYPKLKGILGFTGGQPPAAAEVIEQAIAAGELKKGQIVVTGVGFPSNCRKYIKNGTLERIFSWESEKLGYTSVYVMNMLRNKQAVEDGVKLPKIGALKVEGSNVWTGMTLVTVDNVDDFDF